MAQRYTASLVVSVTALGLATALACGHGGDDPNTADNANVPQPTEDQAWSIAGDLESQDAADLPDGAIDMLPGSAGPDPDAGPPPGTPPPGMPAGWETFVADACGVTVFLPHHAKDHPNPKTGTHSYRYHIGGEPDGAYLVQCTQSPAGAQAWLDASTRRLAKRGTISSQTQVSAGSNASGREIKLDLPSGGTLEARLLVTTSGKEILLLVAMGNKLWVQSDADAFLQSAQIK
jgi:hypothetical protein